MGWEMDQVRRQHPERPEAGGARVRSTYFRRIAKLGQRVQTSGQETATAAPTKEPTWRESPTRLIRTVFGWNPAATYPAGLILTAFYPSWSTGAQNRTLSISAFACDAAVSTKSGGASCRYWLENSAIEPKSRVRSGRPFPGIVPSAGKPMSPS